jgi:hypothetical protein
MKKRISRKRKMLKTVGKTIGDFITVELKPLVGVTRFTDFNLDMLRMSLGWINHTLQENGRAAKFTFAMFKIRDDADEITMDEHREKLTLACKTVEKALYVDIKGASSYVTSGGNRTYTLMLSVIGGDKRRRDEATDGVISLFETLLEKESIKERLASKSVHYAQDPNNLPEGATIFNTVLEEKTVVVNRSIMSHHLTDKSIDPHEFIVNTLLTASIIDEDEAYFNTYNVYTRHQDAYVLNGHTRLALLRFINKTKMSYASAYRKKYAESIL